MSMVVQQAGLHVQVGGQWVDVEASLQLGDICMFRPDVLHDVLPIDPGEAPAWASSEGRWTMFSPIAHVADRNKNEKMIGADRYS